MSFLKKYILPVLVLGLLCGCQKEKQDASKESGAAQEAPVANEVAVTEDVASPQKHQEEKCVRPPLKVIRAGDAVWTAENMPPVGNKELNLKFALCNRGDALCERDSSFIVGENVGGRTVFTWNEAINVCPQNFRLPTKEEFKKRKASDLGEGSWWTLNIVNMMTNDDKRSDGSSSWGTVVSAVASVNVNSDSVEFIYDKSGSRHSVLCVVDSNEYYRFVDDIPARHTVIEGTVTKADYDVHVSSDYHCAECCCGEGSGGIQKVVIVDENQQSFTEKIRELYVGRFCPPPREAGDESFEDVAEVPDSNCIEPSLEIFDFLQFFRSGATVKVDHCRKKSLEIVEIDETGIFERNCGDSILVSVMGTVEEVEEFTQENNLFDEDTLHLCSYKIKLLSDDSFITTTHSCANVTIGIPYKVKATLTKKSDELGAVVQVMYPCCMGEENGHSFAKLEFEPIAQESSIATE